MAWYFSSEYKDFDAEIYWTPEDKRIDSEEERFDAVCRQLAKDIEAEYLATHSVISMDSPAYPRFGSSFGPGLLDGWRFPMPDTPYRSQLVKFETDIIDIVSTPFGSWALSERVINMIEKVEPGVHQYLPFEMLNPDGRVNPARRWILNTPRGLKWSTLKNLMWRGGRRHWISFSLMPRMTITLS